MLLVCLQKVSFTYNRQQNCLDTDLKWGTSISGKETNFTPPPASILFFAQVAIMY